MALPGLPNLGLSLGGGPSQAINNAAPVLNTSQTGPFAVGHAKAVQDNKFPDVSNSTGNGANNGSPFGDGGIFGTGSLLPVIILLGALFYFRKKA